MDQPAEILPVLLGLATLLPLASFFTILVAGPRLGRHAGSVSVGAIVGAGVLAFVALAVWLGHHFPHGAEHATHVSQQHGESASGDASKAEEHGAGPVYYAGDYYVIGRFGSLRLTMSYYIDALTICMFCMVTFIASCIHIYSTGYMHEELHDVTDHEVHTEDGGHFQRPGRYPRFFQYMSLFSFSMLGLILAGNVFMVFVFWELVGICSYFLIGFYIERKSATNAGNKAFIVNRVGDFGMIVGLMVIWAGLGTFALGDQDVTGPDGLVRREKGIFSLVRPTRHEVAVAHNGEHANEENGHVDHEDPATAAAMALEPAPAYDNALRTPDGFVRLGAYQEVEQIARQAGPDATPEEIDQLIAHQVPSWRNDDPQNRGAPRFGYGWLIIAGLGIFCGCVGKSAQFPLHVWLPDAMEGPTPVSALVHSATMVAAGVYLVARFFPFFTPEVLLIIAATGCITLLLAATIAITATDIKRVLAYSTISQLGYMMLGLGLGGWLAGALHLLTHAFFKSLLFLCSGSVIHAVHTNDMRQMGGLWRKMPYTAFTMLVGCLAIAGASIPFVVGLSGYYSKDAILEQAFSFMQTNRGAWGAVFFLVAVGGAAITAFYMFRLWYLTFVGQPRDHHRYEHAHESPKVMYVPLVILAVLAVCVAWQPFQWDVLGPIKNLSVVGMLESARPAGTAPVDAHGAYLASEGLMTAVTVPNEHAIHEPAAFWTIKFPVTMLAFGTAVVGIALATVIYWLRWLDAEEARKQFGAIYRLLINKWWFDELYDWLFVRPVFLLSRVAAGIDRRIIDGVVDGIARVSVRVADIWDRVADRTLVDGLVNLMAAWTYNLGLGLRQLQTGKLRQYVLFIVVGAISVFILISFFWPPARGR